MISGLYLKGNVTIPAAASCVTVGIGEHISGAFYCDSLPVPPKEILAGSISFDWADMIPERLHRILYIYANYWDTRGRDADTWGLGSGLDLSPVAGPNARFNMSFGFHKSFGWHTAE
jgi:hypothetical protein